MLALHSSHFQLFYMLQTRCMSQAQFPVITIPVALQERRKREKLKENKNKRALQIHQSRKGNHNIPIISCRRKELNHYLGQSYNKFAEVPLASNGWLHKKAAGDFFTINGHGPNPAFADCDNEDEDFTSLGLEKNLVAQLNKMGFERPTNIQSLAIPHVLDGKNTLITAETGNGKTLAFIAPMLQQIAEKKKVQSELPMNSPRGLVMVPGKELAAQIHGVASQVGEGLGIKVKLLTGGGTKKKMLTPPMSQQDLLVASFGAMSKLTTVGVYDMSFLTHITLDEADTLLDDSFNEEVTRFITKQPIQGSGDDEQPEVLSGAQLTLVAATTPTSLAKILDPIVNLDSLVHLSTPHLNRPMPHVHQRFLRVNSKTRTEKLLSIVKKDVKRGSPVIIFSNKSSTCDWISMLLNENGVRCMNLNGATSSFLREKHYKAFTAGEVKVLSCTDLISRGLDTYKVPHVINFDFPSYVADYIHRCGRTGRVGGASSSVVTNLVHQPWEVELVKKIEYAVRKGEEFHNVNANIKRIITARIQREEEQMLKSIV